MMQRVLSQLGLFVFSALLLTTVPTQAQLITEYGLKEAKVDLLVLKNSALLVRLPNRDAKIAALEQTGRVKEAEAERRALKDERKEILLSFEQTYNFGRVYFFEDTNYRQISAKQLSGILVDAKGNVIPESELPTNFLIGAFDETRNLNIRAFLVMDSDFLPLKSPFPYYQRTNYFFSLFSYSKAEVIEKWNDRLEKTYARWFAESAK